VISYPSRQWKLAAELSTAGEFYLDIGVPKSKATTK
jgi:hypothetical protein